MTRDEFMAKAKDEIDKAFSGQKNRMMNLVEQAWAEGKRNAELDEITDIIKKALDRAQPSYPVTPNYPDPNAKWIDHGGIPTGNPGEYVASWECINCGKIVTEKTAYCPGCGAPKKVSGE